MPGAAPARILRPVSSEPVKLMPRTSRWRTKASPASSPKPVMTLTTPLGMPAWGSSSANLRALSGDCSAGFSTAVQPAASAGASGAHGHAEGKVPRHDMGGYPQGLQQGEIHHLGAQRNGLALHLVGSPGVVA